MANATGRPIAPLVLSLGLRSAESPVQIHPVAHGLAETRLRPCVGTGRCDGKRIDQIEQRRLRTAIGAHLRARLSRSVNYVYL